MASKPDNKEYFKNYNSNRDKQKRKEFDEKRKEKRKVYDKERLQKQKEEEDLQKYRDFKSQLEETKTINTWYSANRNPYLNRLPMEEDEKWRAEKRKRFFLQYDMVNLYLRKKGDSKSYSKNREEAYRNFCYEKDLFNRIQYYRIFRRTFKSRMGGESPDKTNQLMNDCFIPSELHPESSAFRPELLHLLEEGENSDPPMKVMIPPEWAQKLIDEDSSDSWDSDFVLEDNY